jgi:acyl-CoA thioester hydrolase
MFEKQLVAGWGDMDFNAHMRNTAYLDKSADVRMMFFAENGYPMSEFRRLQFGPVVMKDEIEYFRELQLLEETKVSLSLAGLSDDGSRMIMCNEFFRADGKLSARVRSAAGWLDLAGRRLIAPPTALLGVLLSLDKSGTFEALPNSVR